jgi:hypothetical protein
MRIEKFDVFEALARFDGLNALDALGVEALMCLLGAVLRFDVLRCLICLMLSCLMC